MVYWVYISSGFLVFIFYFYCNSVCFLLMCVRATRSPTQALMLWAARSPYILNSFRLYQSRFLLETYHCTDCWELSSSSFFIFCSLVTGVGFELATTPYLGLDFFWMQGLSWRSHEKLWAYKYDSCRNQWPHSCQRKQSFITVKSIQAGSCTLDTSFPQSSSSLCTHSYYLSSCILPPRLTASHHSST